MTDIASLGVEVTTTGVDKGSKDLDKYAASADKAALSAERLRKATAEADTAETRAAATKTLLAQREDSLAATRARSASIVGAAAARTLASDASIQASMNRTTLSATKLAAGTKIAADQQVRAAALASAAVNTQANTTARLTSTQLRQQNIAAAGSAAATKQANLAIIQQNQIAASAARAAGAQARAQTLQQNNQRAAANANLRGPNQGFGNNNVANIAAQFQDIGVTAAMGMSPMTVALQQGTQLSAIFSGMKNPISAIGMAIRSILSPMSLLVIATIAAGTALYQWWSNRKGVESLDDVLKKHTKTVENLKTLYGATAQEMADLIAVPGGVGLSKSMINIDIETLRKNAELAKGIISQTLAGKQGYHASVEKNDMGWFAELGSPADLVNARKNLDFAPFAKSMDTFFASIRSGRPDFEKFGEDLQAVVDAGGGAQDIINRRVELVLMTSDALDVSGQFEVFKDPINKFRLGIAEGNADIKAFVDELQAMGLAGGEAMEKLADKAIALSAPLFKYLQALRAIREAFEAFTKRAESKFQDEYFTGSSIKGFNDARARDRAFEDIGLAADRESGLARTDSERIAAARGQAGSEHRALGYDRNEAMRVAEIKERSRIEAEITKTVRDRLDARRESLEQSEQELTVIGATVERATYLNEQFRMMAEIKKDAAEHGRIISDEEVAAVEKTARELARIADLKARMSLTDELAFDRDQQFRTGMDQSIASRQRAAGLEVDMDSPIAQRMRDLQKFNEAKGLGSGFLEAFKSELLESGGDIGKSFGQAILSAATNAMDEQWSKIFDRIATMFASALTGQMPGTTGGAASSVASTAASFAGRLSTGDNTSAGAPYGEVIRAPLAAISAAAPSGATAAVGEVEAYIRKGARLRNMNEDIAVRVAQSEGGLKNPFRQGESMLKYGREESYGPFQLHMRQGGVGTRALAAGIDPRTNWQGGVDYGMNEAAEKGWGQWYGAAKAGIGNREGLEGAHAIPLNNFTTAVDKAAVSAVNLDAGMTGVVKAVTGSVTGAAGAGGTALGGLAGLFTGKTGVMADGSDPWGGKRSVTGGGGTGGGLGGIFGSILSFLPKLFGFSDGGYTGAGGASVPAGIVHRNEVVWSQKDVARAGGVENVEKMRGGEYGHRAKSEKVELHLHIDGASGDNHVRTLVKQGGQELLAEYHQNQERGGIGETQRRYQNQKAS